MRSSHYIYAATNTHTHSLSQAHIVCVCVCVYAYVCVCVCIYIYTCAHTCQAVELECEFPFDDLRDNPDGKPGKLSEGKGTWNPEHFIDNLPDTVVKVCVYMLGPHRAFVWIQMFVHTLDASNFRKVGVNIYMERVAVPCIFI